LFSRFYTQRAASLKSVTLCWDKQLAAYANEQLTYTADFQPFGFENGMHIDPNSMYESIASHGWVPSSSIPSFAMNIPSRTPPIAAPFQDSFTRDFEGHYIGDNNYASFNQGLNGLFDSEASQSIAVGAASQAPSFHLNEPLDSMQGSAHLLTPTIPQGQFGQVAQVAQATLPLATRTAASGMTPALAQFHCTQIGCPVAFKRDPDRVRHEAALHGINQGFYLCPVAGCIKNQGARYSRKDKLTEHMWKKHANLGFTKRT
jgi:hypothetical protein